MITLKGQAVCPGVAFGKLELLKKTSTIVLRTHVEDTKNEIERFEAARKTASEQLKALYEKALNEVGEENAMIFDIHQMMLEDQDYLDSVHSHINDQ